MLAAKGYGADERFIARGLSSLKAQRDERQRWRVFPFWYTVLALSELEHTDARSELAYVAPVLERAARQTAPVTGFAARRRLLAQRALARL